MEGNERNLREDLESRNAFGQGVSCLDIARFLRRKKLFQLGLVPLLHSYANGADVFFGQSGLNRSRQHTGIPSIFTEHFCGRRFPSRIRSWSSGDTCRQAVVGQRIGGVRMFQYGHLCFVWQRVVVGLWFWANPENGVKSGRPYPFTHLNCRALPTHLLHHGALLSWTIARMRCRSSADRAGQAAMTSWSARSSGTNWALIDGEQAMSGWCSDGEGLVGVASPGQVTTPDCGFSSGCREQEGKWRRRESNPRPKAFGHSVYMLIRGFCFRLFPTSPAGQGTR